MTDENKKASSWWQWVLIYPTFGVALLSAAPEWADKVDQMYGKYFTTPEQQNLQTRIGKFMLKNPECTRAPVYWIETADKTEVDGTICQETGDVWLRIRAKNGVEKYEPIEISKIMEGDGNKASLNLGLVSSAYAAIQPQNSSKAKGRMTLDGKSFKYAQQMAIVVCQRLSDNAKLIRHLRAGNTCYDEIVDTNSGFVISKNTVACRTSC